MLNVDGLSDKDRLLMLYELVDIRMRQQNIIFVPDEFQFNDVSGIAILVTESGCVYYATKKMSKEYRPLNGDGQTVSIDLGYIWKELREPIFIAVKPGEHHVYDADEIAAIILCKEKFVKFIKSNPGVNKIVVICKDGNRSNLRWDNLEFSTPEISRRYYKTRNNIEVAQCNAGVGGKVKFSLFDLEIKEAVWN